MGWPREEIQFKDLAAFGRLIRKAGVDPFKHKAVKVGKRTPKLRKFGRRASRRAANSTTLGFWDQMMRENPAWSACDETCFCCDDLYLSGCAEIENFRAWLRSQDTQKKGTP